MTMFLSKTQLQELTGKQRPSAQKRVLDDQQIPYAVDSHGWPKVLVSTLEQVLGPQTTSKRARRRGPDFEALRG